jgi:hypothetical protein
MEVFMDLIGWAEDDIDFKNTLIGNSYYLEPLDTNAIHYEVIKQAERWRNRYAEIDKIYLKFEVKYLTRMIESCDPLLGWRDTTTHRFYFSQYLKGIYVFKKCL